MGAGSLSLESLSAWEELSRTSIALLILAVTLLIFFIRKLQDIGLKHKDIKLPPRIPSKIPFLGSALDFNRDPIKFLRNGYEKYGEVFSFTMVGQTFTYLIGPDASAHLFNSKNDDLNAEEVYANLTVPVFGKGVAYDIPNPKFLEQKKMFKLGLSIAQFRKHTPLIMEETEEYFKRWGDEGEKDLFVALSELIILTASRCLHGKEVRSMLNERVAQLYDDLDGGLSALAWLFPPWIPFPSFLKRDSAHLAIKKIFYQAIKQRRASNEPEDDMLQTLLNSTYKNGTPLTDDEIAGMFIGLLMAGQHTSSSTSAWLGFFLAQDKQLQEECYEEQMRICGTDRDHILDYDQIKAMTTLDRCLKETLRIRPPVLQMMRMVKTPLKFKDYTIPLGHQVCACPRVNQTLKDKWSFDVDAFNPDRFLDESTSNSDKFSYIPFGAGRHRCIGENFAYVQIKTIWSVLLRKYEFDLVDGYFPTVCYQTLIHTPTKPIIKYRLR